MGTSSEKKTGGDHVMVSELFCEKFKKRFSTDEIPIKYNKDLHAKNQYLC